MELLLGLMVIDMKENLKRIISKAMGDMFGLMVDSMKAFGVTIRCMEKVLLFGQMGASMRESIYIRKRKVMESLLGLTVVATKVSGRMASRTDVEYTVTSKGYSE